MTRVTPALFSHAETLLAELLTSDFPADSAVSRYFRQQRGLGHSDRGFIAETVYAILRRKRSLSARCPGGATPRCLLLAALACAREMPFHELEPALKNGELAWLARARDMKTDALPPAVRLDLPDWLYERLTEQLGQEKTALLADSLNRPAPLDLRVNPLKTTREELMARLRADGFDVSACRFSPLGVRLASKPSLARHPLFLDGSFEVQDEGSQLLVFLLQPKRGEMTADFCAGAGGKTLLIGALMRSKGSLYAFDVSEKRLSRLEPRLARSGLSNVRPVRIASANDARVKRLAGKFDRVFVDAPCSGLGTVRRNPDLKWRQTPESVNRLITVQREILESASRLLKRGGRLVYATCSPLNEENESVVRGFLEARPDFILLPASDILKKQNIDVVDGESGAFLRLYPFSQGTDGFFAAVMEREL
ncbi:MAG: RsmB/NOP family class I SAM-dependent RNA methyltransferase [Candidatus Accumulibacter sp.]|jgi:16S rRNA (cytosine967-C5)-methyltransferase|nr:RsmB/NOP family class I SAM-dependent RNA methyltransferase [Accumulibacter sp.]